MKKIINAYDKMRPRAVRREEEEKRRQEEEDFQKALQADLNKSPMVRGLRTTKEGLLLCLVVSRLLASTEPTTVARLPWLARSLPAKTRVGGTCAQGRAPPAACCRSSPSGSRDQLPRRGRLARETPRSAPASPGQTTTSCARGRASRRRPCAPSSPRPTFAPSASGSPGRPGLACLLVDR